MNHKVFGNRLSRPINQRKALYKSLINALFIHDKIETTDAKAKAVRGEAEKLITKAKKQTLVSRRQLNKFLTIPVADKLFTTGKDEFKSRNSGYTRIVQLGDRFSDTARIVRLELLIDEVKENKAEETGASVENSTTESKKKLKKVK